MSVSRLEPGTGSLRTLLNVGDLGPGEERWPANEIYRLEDFAQLRTVVSELRSWTVTLNDPQADAQEAALLRSLGEAHSLGAPVVLDGALWGEFYATRRAEQVRFGARDTAYTEALVAILAGAVSRALHVESLERLAFVDPLTRPGQPAGAGRGGRSRLRRDRRPVQSPGQHRGLRRQRAQAGQRHRRSRRG